MRRKNVFVVGLDDTHHHHLAHVSRVQESCDLYGVLTPRELSAWRSVPLHTMFERAVDHIDEHACDVDAILGFGSFPVQPLVCMLCEHYGVAGTPLSSAVAAEHEYWSRAMVLQASPSNVLPFAVLDVFDDRAVEAIHVEMPLRIRPIHRLADHLDQRVATALEFEAAVARLRDELPGFSPAFDDLLSQVDLPHSVEGFGGRHCLLEPVVGTQRCIVEGYVYGREVHSYGVVDVVPRVRDSLLARYEYPSRLPFPVQDELKGIVNRVMREFDFVAATFHMELAWDALTDEIWVLETRAGPGVQDIDLFEMVDGRSGYAVAVDIALGLRPTYVHGRGPYGCAAKFLVRAFGDGVVTRTPTSEELLRIRQTLLGVDVRLQAEAGDRIGRASGAGTEDHGLAWVSIGGSDAEHVLEDYESCKLLLQFGFSEPGMRWH